MRYALIDQTGLVLAVSEVESPEYWTHPDDCELVGAEGWYPEHDSSEYTYADGVFTWHEPPAEPMGMAEAAALMMQAAQGIPIPDAKAALMAPYLPAFDARVEYAEGSLAVRSGRVCRKTSIGWRELG
jgi:hypothetical protein